MVVVRGLYLARHLFTLCIYVCVCVLQLGYLFTGGSLDRQVDHRIYRLICVDNCKCLQFIL